MDGCIDITENRNNSEFQGAAMSDVIPFQPRRPTATDDEPICLGTVDATALAFQPLSRTRELLYGSIHQADPLLIYEVLRVVGDGLDQLDMTDSEAQSHGWADAATMRRRGKDIQQLLLEFRRQIIIVCRQDGPLSTL